jgi:hypothetical protein
MEQLHTEELQFLTNLDPKKAVLILDAKTGISDDELHNLPNFLYTPILPVLH